MRIALFIGIAMIVGQGLSAFRIPRRGYSLQREAGKASGLVIAVGMILATNGP